MFQIDLKQGASATAAAPALRGDVQEIARSFAPVIAAVAFLLVATWTFGRLLDRSIEKQEAAVASLEASLNASRQQLAEISGKRRIECPVQIAQSGLRSRCVLVHSH